LVVFNAGTDAGEDFCDGNSLAATVASRIPVVLPNDFLFRDHVLADHITDATSYKSVACMVNIREPERNLDFWTQSFYTRMGWCHDGGLIPSLEIFEFN
jgi:hypothetical protein